MAYEAYNKSLPALSSLFEANKRRAQETEALKMATSEKRDSEQFNFLNAATRAIAAMVAGGGPANPMAWLSAGASALGADRGKEFKPLESAISGAATGMTAKALPGGGDIAKTGVEALNVDNLGKTLPFLQSLSPKADSLGILGNIVAQKQNEEKILREQEAEKAKRDFEMRKTLAGSQYATPALLNQLLPESNIPIATDQSMQPATELFKTPEKTDIATQKAKADLEEKTTKLNQAETDKALQPFYNQLTNKITEAISANDFDRLSRISAQASTGLSGSKELQDKISKQVADATNTITNRGFQMTQAQFNRAMAQGNLAVRNELLNLRKDNLLKSDTKTKTIPIGSVQNLSEMKTSTKLLDEIVNKIDTGKVGPVQGVNRFNPYDAKVQAFNQLIASTKQVIGKSLEGGVLRLEDEKKYEKIIPKITDTKSTLIAKVNNLRSMIETKHNDMLTEFENSGYRINNLKPIQSKYYSLKSKKQVQQTQVKQMKIGRFTVEVQ